MKVIRKKTSMLIEYFQIFVSQPGATKLFLNRLEDSLEFLKCFACGALVRNNSYVKKCVANELPKAVVQPMMKQVETRPESSR